MTYGIQEEQARLRRQGRRKAIECTRAPRRAGRPLQQEDQQEQAGRTQAEVSMVYAKKKKSRNAAKTTPRRPTVVTHAKKAARKPMNKKDEDLHARSEAERKKADAEREARASKASPYRDPPAGSTQPSQTTKANPEPQNVEIPPQEPTADPMATPEHSTLPNPPSRPGGDLVGDPNMTPTGERLPTDHPDYRKDAEGYRAPDHRSQAEKEAGDKEHD
jgi:hypothetical protein